MVDSLFTLIVCNAGLCFFFILVSSLNVFTVDCFLVFAVMKKSVRSIYASGQ